MPLQVSSLAELMVILGVDATQTKGPLRELQVELEKTAAQAARSAQTIRGAFDVEKRAMEERRILARQIDLESAQYAADKARRDQAYAQEDKRRQLESLEIARMRQQIAYATAPDRKGNLAESLAISGMRDRLGKEILNEEEQLHPTTELGGGRLTGIASRIALYYALYKSVEFATDAIRRSIDIQRQSEQTGFGVQGTQRFQYAAAATGTPIEAAASAVARLQERMNDLPQKGRDALSKLGIDFTQFKDLIERDPEAAIVQLGQALSETKNKAEITLALFGSRSGRSIALFEEMAKRQGETNVLTEKQVEDIRNVAAAWEVAYLKAQAYFARLVLGFKEYNEFASGTGAIREHLSPGETPGGPNKRNFNIDLPRDVGATQAEIDTINQQGEALKKRLELEDKEQAQIKETSGLLKQFGVVGTQTAKLITSEFSKVTAEFNAGRISADQLRLATWNYHRLLEAEATREKQLAALAAAERAKNIAAHDRMYGAVTDVIGGVPYRRNFEGSPLPQERQPIPVDLPWWKPGVAKDPAGNTPPLKPQASNQVGTVNLVALDQFSEMMVRRWKQQGLLTA